MQWIRDIHYSKHLNGTKTTFLMVTLFLLIILGAFMFRVGCYVSDTSKRIDSWCSHKLRQLNTWRT